MLVKCLDSAEKDAIVHYITVEQMKQEDVANIFNVSRKTIYRVLLERGEIVPQEVWDTESAKIIREVRARGLNARSLKRALDEPAITMEQVEAFINQCDEHQRCELHFLIEIAQAEAAHAIA